MITVMLLLAQDTFVDRAIGKWEGTGQLMDDDARAQIEWERVLDGAFVRCRVRYATTETFEGVAYYLALGEGRYYGVWGDSHGTMLTLDGRATADAIEETWSQGRNPAVRTTYRIAENGSIALEESMRATTGWNPFANLTLSRVEAWSEELPGPAIHTERAEYMTSLTGTWTGEAEFAGERHTATATWSWTLADEFACLEYVIGDAFEGHGYYRAGPTGEVHGVWFDSNGNTFPLQGEHADGTLTIDWGSDNYRGRSTYSLDEEGRLVIVDAIDDGGNYSPFGRATLTRE